MVAYTMFDLYTGAKLPDYSVSAPVLSLQDAFALYDFPEVAVFPGACSVANYENCTASCLDASTMFGGLEIFHNCLIYPVVAGLYGNGSLNDPSLADSLGIHNQSQAMQTANNISTTIYSCLSTYCREDKHCTSDLGHSEFEHTIDLLYPAILEFDICNYVAPFSFLNADIGGVGVSTNPIWV